MERVRSDWTTEMWILRKHLVEHRSITPVAIGGNIFNAIVSECVFWNSLSLKALCVLTSLIIGFAIHRYHIHIRLGSIEQATDRDIINIERSITVNALIMGFLWGVIVLAMIHSQAASLVPAPQK